MKVLKIAVSAGHSNVQGKDRGASSGKYVEGVLTAECRSLLVSGIRARAQAEDIPNIDVYLLLDGDDSVLADTLAAFKNKTDENTLLIDIHFNAGPAAAKGTEVLVPQVYTKAELEIADRISDIISTVLGTPERGAKGSADGVKDEGESNRGKLGWMRLPGHNILIEVEFLSNPSAMAIYDAKKVELWNNIAAYVTGLLKQSL